MAEVRIEGAEPAPAESHFFVAVCAHRPQIGNPTFVFVPRAGNVLRERERHIMLLAAELAQKDEWLEKAKQELAALNDDHQKLLAMYRQQKKEMEERTEWAMQLNRELEERGPRIQQLQDELAREQAEARTMAEGYERKVRELEDDVREKTEWALETERRLGRELEERTRELAEAVEHLYAAEKTIEERTAWIGRLQEQVKQLEMQMAMARASRWLKLGRTFGLGPELPER